MQKKYKKLHLIESPKNELKKKKKKGMYIGMGVKDPKLILHLRKNITL